MDSRIRHFKDRLMESNKMDSIFNKRLNINGINGGPTKPNQTLPSYIFLFFFFSPASNTLSIKPSLDRKSLFTVAISSGRHENVERSIDDGSLSFCLLPNNCHTGSSHAMTSLGGRSARHSTTHTHTLNSIAHSMLRSTCSSPLF